MHDWRKDDYVINTIQHMLTNAKMDDVSIYAEGDNPIWKIKKRYIKHGSVHIPYNKKVMLWDDTEQRIIALGPQEVYNSLFSWLILDPDLNCTQEQREQVIEYFKNLNVDLFEPDRKGGIIVK